MKWNAQINSDQGDSITTDIIKFLITLMNGMIELVQIDAYTWDGTMSYGPGHGRPVVVTPQVRELNQVVRLIKSLFKSPNK